MVTEEYLGVKEAAKHFNVAKSTIYEALKTGRIPFFKIGVNNKGPIRIRYQDLIERFRQGERADVGREGGK